MASDHTTFFADSGNMGSLENESIALMVTSPPYPMIEMWDAGLGEADPQITQALEADDGPLAFELMHQILDKIWAECHRVLIQGGFACINIGDATRTIGKEFALYTNRARIDRCMIELGFTALPSIIWRKQSNAPNKFMGSGMLPAGAYVTHEHEHILIYRKGGKRQFTSKEEKLVRRESSFFWEERNVWFSDLWDLKGTRQVLGDSADRERSAAYPFELPFRIIAMYSVKGDTVLDPFMGTGSTHAAAMALGRNSIGYEIDPTLEATIEETLSNAVEWGQKRQQDRIEAHAHFVEQREGSGKEVKHFNENFQMKVMTSQEKDLEIEKSSESDYIHTFSASSGEGPKPGWELEPDGHTFWEQDEKKGWAFKHEFILNGSNQRGSSLTGRNYVDSPPTICRDLKPKTFETWVEGYFQIAMEKKKDGKPVTPESLCWLGGQLKKRVHRYWAEMDMAPPPIPDSTYHAFIVNLVLRRTWDGWVGEHLVQSWLKDELAVDLIKPDADIDAGFGVDILIPCGSKYIGIQVKPADTGMPPNAYLVAEQHSKQHHEFENQFGGKVFYVEYTSEEGVIIDPNLIASIKTEMKRIS